MNLVVTGAREGSPPHLPGSAHNSGLGADLGKRSNPGLTRQNFEGACFEQCFNPFEEGRRPVLPNTGLLIPTERGDYLLLPGMELGPVANGRGYRFRYGPELELRVMGPRPEEPWNAPNGYIVLLNASGQPIDPDTGRTMPKGSSHIKRIVPRVGPF